MGFLGLFEARALSDTCVVTTGSIYSPTVTTGLPCRMLPPSNEQDDTIVDFLVKDTAGVLSVGGRVTHHAIPYLITRLRLDGVYSRVSCQKWEESL
jgi:hypothetical protein